jgi:2,3-bisphosphoglycerate-independent phosphoglycerate mutase
MNFLAQYGECGMVRTVPDGVFPGSDTANLSALGYDPRKYYTGRTPLEAVSMGLELGGNDVAVRCNLVTLAGGTENYQDKIMLDYSSDEISTPEAAELIQALNRHFGDDAFVFHPGISYRHCAVWKNGKTGLDITPPHDILDQKIGGYLPREEKFTDFMRRSVELLEAHPVNLARVKNGLNPANSIWLWGEGKRAALPAFSKKYNLSGAMISEVDLLKGIGRCAGLEIIDVEGATGNIHTNFEGMAQAAVDAFKKGLDFVYLHLEAPDECGHRFEIQNKVRSIEYIDSRTLRLVLDYLNTLDDFAVLLLPDHPTPLSLRTHTSGPVPYVIYRKSGASASGTASYDEPSCSGGIFMPEGHLLMDRFLR